METSCGNRVVIIGSSNAGKSTLAERLATHRGVPFIELDALHWEANWTMAEPEVFRARISAAIKPEAWVMAGNYTQHMDLSWGAADTIVWLDLPLPLVARRCVARTWRRWRTQEVIWGNNRENFREHLCFWDTDKSLLSYTIVNHHRRQRKYSALMSDPAWSHLAFIRLRSVGEVEHWFQQVTSGDATLGAKMIDVATRAS